MLSGTQDYQQMQTMMSSMIDAVLICDIQGRIIMANKAAENLFLVREGGLVGKRLNELGYESEIANMVGEVLERGNEVFIETIVNPSPQVYRVHVSAIKNEFNIIDGAIAVFHDVTDARNFAQMRSEFVGNVSHELRTPLTSIKGFVETLLDGAMENSTICRRFLSIIDSETDRLSRLIEDLLTLSAIESKERIVRPQPVCLVRSIRGVMNILGPQISEKSLHVEYVYPDELSLILADEDLLGQVLINLLDNAIKYTPPGGNIMVRSRKKDSRVITTITDTGVGIPPESLPRVFERFYRVDKARSRNQGGTGLGLSIVKHIVESHGGEVFVESEVGQGSTFGVSFLAV
ncbi:ATP-binding protein [Syntrophomonas palmitatica]|uniref:ATP-binding protein n=1 Tax=Syntrophomonas palmitatica TaxID=402877 RepID=UPI0006CF3BB2|nr:ATP-binding protein [Syntrophomonas palmitatica]